MIQVVFSEQRLNFGVADFVETEPLQVPFDFIELQCFTLVLVSLSKMVPRELDKGEKIDQFFEREGSFIFAVDETLQ